jgi:hypothetical protein
MENKLFLFIIYREEKGRAKLHLLLLIFIAVIVNLNNCFPSSPLFSQHRRDSYLPYVFHVVSNTYFLTIAEAEFLDVFGTSVLRVFLLAIHSPLY